MNLIIKSLKEILKNDNRYSNFTFLEYPVKFKEYFKDKNFKCVQVYDCSVYGTGKEKFISGYAGSFAFEDNKIVSLDGDSYNDDMTIYGYEYFDKDGEIFVDILTNDW